MNPYRPLTASSTAANAAAITHTSHGTRSGDVLAGPVAGADPVAGAGLAAGVPEAVVAPATDVPGAAELRC
jgi:hypothetical protein